MTEKLRLEQLLDALAGFLDAHPTDSRGHFARQVRASLDEVRRGDAHGMRRFVGLHGGLGSLSDIYFHPANGNAESEEEGRALQARFDELDGTALSLAGALLREWEGEGR